jgi:DNA-binding FadR family transcriptional regulator
MKRTALMRPHRKLPSLSVHAHRLSQSDIVAILGAEILSGARKPGERMPSDAEMLKTFGVSRVVTREVTKTLAAKGMVASRMKVGTVVLEPSRWNWLDPDVLSWRVADGLDLGFLAHITDVRRAVEPVAASLAATHRTRADLAALRKAVEDMANAKEDRRLFTEADLRFHVAVSAASRNPFFQSFAGVIETALAAILSVNAYAHDRQRLAYTVQTHSAVVDAIEAGDAAKASERMHEIVQSGLSQVKRARRKMPF